MTIEEIKSAHMIYNDHYHRNHSRLYELTKDLIDWSEYPDEEKAFVDEFVCFEDDYYNYILHMERNNIIPKQVVDIGCQLGVQAFIFRDLIAYIGIDSYPIRLKLAGATFLNEMFPNLSISLENKTVISNMSLGYFNSEKFGVTDSVIIDNLKNCKTLYIASTWNIINSLRDYYKHFEQFKDDMMDEFPRVCLWN